MLKEIPPVKLYFPDEDIEEIKVYVEKILRSGMLTLYTYTNEFEKKFADLCRVKHAIAVNSGTSALEIALRSIGLHPGDEVLVPTNTFTSTAASIFFAGGRPKFTDIDPESLCIDMDNIQNSITKKTKGVIIVHVGGLVCPDTMKIQKFCKEEKLFLIEDAAHAHGSTINGISAGSIGDVAAFSFYPTKVMTAGEGGMITTNRDDISEKAKILRDQGKSSFSGNEIVELGYNWRMPEINAAIGLVQLKRLEEILERRRKIAEYYTKELEKLDRIYPLKIPSNIKSSYYKYVAFLDRELDRDRFKQMLRDRGVRCGGEVYWPPLHLQPIYKKLLNTKRGDFPVAEDICSRMVSLPIYTQMTMNEAEYVIEKIKEILKEM